MIDKNDINIHKSQIQGEKDIAINSCGTPEFMAPEVSFAFSSKNFAIILCCAPLMLSEKCVVSI